MCAGSVSRARLESRGLGCASCLIVVEGAPLVPVGVIFDSKVGSLLCCCGRAVTETSEASAGVLGDDARPRKGAAHNTRGSSSNLQQWRMCVGKTG